MKSLRTVLIVLFLSSAVFASDWVSLAPGSQEGATPVIKVLSCDVHQTQVQITLPGFFVSRTPDGDLISVPGCGSKGDVGLPAIPAVCYLLALPEGGAVEIEVDELSVMLLDGYDILMQKEPETDAAAAAPSPKPLPWQRKFPSVSAEQGSSGYISELPVCSIRTYPFRVDAVSGSLSVCSRMNVTVKHECGTPNWPAPALSSRLVKRCSDSVVNFEFVPKGSPSRGSDTRYLIITTPALGSAVQPLAEWRNKSGLKTEVVTVSTGSQQTVKNIIYQYPDLEYVLLVGDSGDIPLAYFSGKYGDHWYACTTGGGNPDLYADLSIGRLCGSYSSRITPQINHILDYEKSPLLGNWLKTTVLVAHKENYPYKYTECKNEIAAALNSSSNWSIKKCYGGESGVSNATLTQMIEDGVNLLNYRGHGDVTEWWSWNNYGESYTNNDVEQLQYTNMRPIVFNIACYNGDISSYCMCECWMDADGGAVAALGATDPSYTIPNHDFDKKLYEAIFSVGLTDIGGALDYAADYIINNHGWLGEDNAKMYLWCGDPAMRVWLDSPSASMSASYDTQIVAGSQSFEVVVTDSGSPVQGATVCLYLEGEVFETGETGANGAVSLDISPASSTCMYVTITHPGYLPHEGEVFIGGGSLMIDTNKISARYGGTVNFTLDAGAGHANRNYVMLGSVTGTSPGTPLPGGIVTLPINFDIFSNIVIALMNTAIFTDFMGTLDGSGQGSAQLNAVPVSGSLVGVNLYFAYGLKGPWNYASDPVTITIEP